MLFLKIYLCIGIIFLISRYVIFHICSGKIKYDYPRWYFILIYIGESILAWPLCIIGLFIIAWAGMVDADTTDEVLEKEMHKWYVNYERLD